MTVRGLLLSFAANLCVIVFMCAIVYIESDFAQASSPVEPTPSLLMDGAVAVVFLLVVVLICTFFSCLAAISIHAVMPVRLGISIVVSIILMHFFAIALAQNLFNDNIFFLPWDSKITLLSLGVGLMVMMAMSCWLQPKYLLLLLPVFVFAMPLDKFYSAQVSEGVRSAAPDVFIIGVDSLRPDYITPNATPKIFGLSQTSKILEPAFTPAARTYAAWVSILLGEYPSKSNARFNLMPEASVSFNNSMQAYFSGRGYQTIYGLDERRFNHIGAQDGFDIVVGPPVTAFEFVASEMVRVPVLGLAAKVQYIRKLFPYGYSNRAAWRQYRPSEFTSSILTEVSRVPIDEPIFMAVHHTLPHWPFESAEVSGSTDTVEKYKEMLVAADKQVGDLLDGLKKLGRLDDALVVFLSDHGETFSGDVSLPSRDGKHWSAMPGHGTDLLSWPQYKVVLQLAERAKNCDVAAAEVYSLVDLRWIIESCIENEAYTPRGHAFLESSLNKMVIDADGAVDAVKTVKGVADLYEISARGQLQLKRENIEPLINEKQVGVTDGINLMASYTNDEARLRVLNFSNNEWRSVSVSDAWGEYRNLVVLLCGEYKQLLERRDVCEP